VSAVHSQAERIAGADATGGDPVFVTGAGKLGTINPPSSARFNEEIKPMDEASEVISTRYLPVQKRVRFQAHASI